MTNLMNELTNVTNLNQARTRLSAWRAKLDARTYDLIDSALIMASISMTQSGISERQAVREYIADVRDLLDK